MIDPEEKLLAAIREEESDFAEALQEANDILYPDPAKALATAISERKTAVAEWKDCLKLCDALTADLEAIRGMVGRPEVPIVEAVRQDLDDRREVKKDLRQQRDDASRYIGNIAVALGLSEYAPAVAVVDAAKAMRAAAGVRAALDRVAKAAGVDSDSTGAIVADLVVDAIRRLSSDRDQMRVARKDAAEDLERLNAILSSAGIDTTGQAADVADRVAAALLRPALPADLRTYLETRRDWLRGADAAEAAALKRWLALPTAEVSK